MTVAQSFRFTYQKIDKRDAVSVRQPWICLMGDNAPCDSKETPQRMRLVFDGLYVLITGRCDQPYGSTLGCRDRDFIGPEVSPAGSLTTE